MITRARDAGISRILTCGEDIRTSAGAVAIARAHDIVRVAVGVHPHRAASLDKEALSALAALAADERVVAIGEIGIDLSGRSAALEVQERAFLLQLDLAAALGLPVVVHIRDAGDTVRALFDGRDGPVRGQLHCYSEGPEELAGWRARGLVPSFAGPVTYPANARLRAAAAADGPLLVETDAPSLAPEGHRGTRNEPAFVAATYARLALERRMTLAALVAETEATARALFGPGW